MKASKLRTIHVIIIGVVACIAVVAGGYFLLIKGQYEEIAKLNARLDTATATANKMPSVQREYEQTLVENAQITARYQHYLIAKMPALSFQDRPQGMLALWREQSETLGPLIQGWPAKTGVQMASTISVPAAPVDPNAINTSLIQIPIGNITVKGDFRSILTHVRTWNNFNRLVQIEPFSLSGKSPELTASYALKVLIFPTGETGPTFSMNGAAAGSSRTASAATTVPRRQ